jgi:murein DD-endopeptidase MepM/ murein hydrolase activator NlpD
MLDQSVLCHDAHLVLSRDNPGDFTVPSYLPSHVLRPLAVQHIGFLNYNRRLLALGAIVASGVMASLPALPASAEVIHEEVEVAVLQSYSAPAHFRVPGIIRDSFAVSSFTLVQWPVPSTTPLSSGFGYRSCDGCSSDHLGIDLNPGAGYSVEAVADGVVVIAEEDSALGVHVVIEHVVDGKVYRSLYAHLQYGSLAVAVGEIVAIGQQVGLVGSTGQSTGPHLHFGILENGVEIDPLPWVQAHANS